MKYSLLDQIAMESEYNSMRLNHFMQCNIDSFAFESANIGLDADSGVITEHDASILYENAFTDIVDKLMAFIQKIIDNIAKFFNELKIRIFGSEKEKEKLKKLKEAAKAAQSKGIKGNAVTKKVKIYKIKRNKKALDAYIKEMSKLERRMLNLKYAAANDKIDTDNKIINYAANSQTNTTAATLIEYDELSKAIDECNKKYDKVVKSNAEVVELALNDAIRFSDKDLDSIGLDLDEIKKGSDKVLAKFKTDAKGVKTKQQANLIQKAVQSIETRVRKSMKEGAEYQTRNSTAVYAFFKAAGLIALGGTAIVAGDLLTGGAVSDKIGDLKDKAADVGKKVVKDGADKFTTVTAAGSIYMKSKKGPDVMNDPVSGATQTIESCLTQWISTGMSVSASIPKNAMEYLSNYMITDGIDKIWQLPHCFTTLKLYDAMLEKDGDYISAKIKVFIKKHPEMNLKYEEISDDRGIVTSSGIKKFFRLYATAIAGVKDIAAFLKDTLSRRERFKESHKKTTEKK